MTEENNEKPEKKKKWFDPLETKEFIVRHMDMEPENADFPIYVNTCDPKTGGEKRFAPGQPVALTRAQVNQLKDAVIDSSFTIGDIGDNPSLALNSKNPLKEAQAMYPDFKIEFNPKTGVMTAIKHNPRYSVELVTKGEDGWAV